MANLIGKKNNIDILTEYNSKLLPGDLKTDIGQAIVLYNNAKFYYQAAELAGALVSYSCSAILFDSILRRIPQGGVPQGGVPVVSVETSKANSGNSTPTTIQEELGGASGVEIVNKAIVQIEGLLVQNTNDDVKKAVSELLYCSLNAVEELQPRVKAGGSKKNDDDEEKDWESICVNYNPLVFTRGSDDCLFFRDVIGLEKEKKMVESSLVYPLVYPNLYPKASKGILIYGPPGTGKTFVVKAAVNELQYNEKDVGVLFFAPSPGDLKGKYVGETEKKIEELFTCASRAACEHDSRCGTKKFISIIFMDEMDAIGPNRDRDTTGLAVNSVNTLLQMMDGIKSFKNVAVVAATNYPWNLDDAILRRFDTQILIDLPTKSDIAKLLRSNINRMLTLDAKPESSSCDKHKKKGSKSLDMRSKDTKSSLNCTLLCEPTIVVERYREAPFNQLKIDFFEKKDIFDAIALDLHKINFSNSDVNRLMKAAATNAGELAVKSNIFYSMSFIDVYKEEKDNKYISCLTQIKDQHRAIIASIAILNALRMSNKDDTQYKNIVEISPPNMISIDYDGHTYYNMKSILYKRNDYVINDPSIEDIYIKGHPIDEPFTSDSIDLYRENILGLKNKRTDKATTKENQVSDIDIILVFNYSFIKTSTAETDMKSLHPISSLANTFFVPMYNFVKSEIEKARQLNDVTAKAGDKYLFKTYNISSVNLAGNDYFKFEGEIPCMKNELTRLFTSAIDIISNPTYFVKISNVNLTYYLYLIYEKFTGQKQIKGLALNYVNAFDNVDPKNPIVYGVLELYYGTHSGMLTDQSKFGGNNLDPVSPFYEMLNLKINGTTTIIAIFFIKKQEDDKDGFYYIKKEQFEIIINGVSSLIDGTPVHRGGKNVKGENGKWRGVSNDYKLQDGEVEEDEDDVFHDTDEADEGVPADITGDYFKISKKLFEFMFKDTFELDPGSFGLTSVSCVEILQPADLAFTQIYINDVMIAYLLPLPPEKFKDKYNLGVYFNNLNNSKDCIPNILMARLYDNYQLVESNNVVTTDVEPLAPVAVVTNAVVPNAADAAAIAPGASEKPPGGGSSNKTMRRNKRKRKTNKTLRLHTKTEQIYVGGAPTNQEFIDFCLSIQSGADDIGSIVSKKIFLSTKFDMQKIKELKRTGGLLLALEVTKRSMTNIKNKFQTTFTSTKVADTASEEFEKMKKKKQLLPTLFRKITALGFIIQPASKTLFGVCSAKIEEDSFEKGSQISWVEVHRIQMNPAALMWLFNKAVDIALFRTSVHAADSLENAGTAAAVVGTGAAAVTATAAATAGVAKAVYVRSLQAGVSTASWIFGQAASLAGSAGSTLLGMATGLVGAPVVTATGAGLMLGGLITTIIQATDKSNVSPEEIINDVVKNFIFENVINIGFVEVSTFDVNPSLMFVRSMEFAYQKLDTQVSLTEEAQASSGIALVDNSNPYSTKSKVTGIDNHLHRLFMDATLFMDAMNISSDYISSDYTPQPLERVNRNRFEPKEPFFFDFKTKKQSDKSRDKLIDSAKKLSERSDDALESLLIKNPVDFVKLDEYLSELTEQSGLLFYVKKQMVGILDFALTELETAAAAPAAAAGAAAVPPAAPAAAPAAANEFKDCIAAIEALRLLNTMGGTLLKETTMTGISVYKALNTARQYFTHNKYSDSSKFISEAADLVFNLLGPVDKQMREVLTRTKHDDSKFFELHLSAFKVKVKADKMYYDSCFKVYTYEKKLVAERQQVQGQGQQSPVLQLVKSITDTESAVKANVKISNLKKEHQEAMIANSKIDSNRQLKSKFEVVGIKEKDDSTMSAAKIIKIARIKQLLDDINIAEISANDNIDDFNKFLKPIEAAVKTKIDTLISNKTIKKEELIKKQALAFKVKQIIVPDVMGDIYYKIDKLSEKVIRDIQKHDMNITKAPDVKKKLTNFNIPIQSFYYAMSVVKSTYTAKSGEMLRAYNEDKTKFAVTYKAELK